MSYEIAKILLWVLISLPILAVCFFLIRNVNKLNRGIIKKRKSKEKAAYMAEKEKRSSYLRRRQFDEDYERMRRGQYNGYEYDDDADSGYYDTFDDGGYDEE